MDRHPKFHETRDMLVKGYVTNIAAALMPAAEVIGKYNDLWQVKKASKTISRGGWVMLCP